MADITGSNSAGVTGLIPILNWSSTPKNGCFTVTVNMQLKWYGGNLGTVKSYMRCNGVERSTSLTLRSSNYRLHTDTFWTETFTVNHSGTDRKSVALSFAREGMNVTYQDKTVNWLRVSGTANLGNCTTLPKAGTTSCRESSGTFTVSISGFSGGYNNAISSYELWYQESTNNSAWSGRVRIANNVSFAYTWKGGVVGRYYRFCAVAIGATYGNSDVNAWGNSLVKRAGVPSAPTWCTAMQNGSSADYTGGDLTVSWGGAGGSITGYELQYASVHRNSGAWSSWTAWATASGTAKTDSRNDLAGTGFKYRVRAMNGGLASAWRESNVMYRRGGMRIKVNGTWLTGTVWMRAGGAWRRARNVYMWSSGAYRKSI